MISFQVDDMTCGHCVSQITKAIQAVDAGATLDFDLANHQVRIAPVSADASTLGAAITAAGFAPMLARDQASARAPGAAPPRSGCCCR